MRKAIVKLGQLFWPDGCNTILNLISVTLLGLGLLTGLRFDRCLWQQKKKKGNYTVACQRIRITLSGFTYRSVAWSKSECIRRAEFDMMEMIPVLNVIVFAVSVEI